MDVGVAGLFVGLATLDVIHRVTAAPGPNAKITALATQVVAGGPATNAALAFAALGGRPTLVTALGAGFAAEAVRAELACAAVRVVDAAPPGFELAPVSAFVVDSTGERSVIGSGRRPEVVVPEVEHLVAATDVVLADGHHPNLALPYARAARALGRPLVLDLSSPKPVYEELIGLASDLICSAIYRTPDGSAASGMVGGGRMLVAVSHGPDPVEWWTADGHGVVPVPAVKAVDTLGAGDVLHGAYAYALAAGLPRVEALRGAVAVAAQRVAIADAEAWWRDPRLRAASGWA